MSVEHEVKTKREQTFEALECRFPGKFMIDPAYKTPTYTAGAKGVYACDYEVRVQVHDELIDISAVAPIRFTEESVGRSALLRVGEYIAEASSAGLCSVLLDGAGRLCVQQRLFADAANVEKAIRMSIGFLDANCLPALAVVVDGDADPRKVAYDASRQFTAKHGFGIVSALKELRLEIKQCNRIAARCEGGCDGR